MLSINISETIWTVINFFLLYFVLKKFLFGPILKVMDARQAKIDAGREAEQAAQQAVDENQEKLSEAKNEARAEAAQLLSSARAEDERRAEAALAQARDEARAAHEAGAQALSARSEQDLADFDGRAPELAAQLAARLLGEK